MLLALVLLLLTPSVCFAYIDPNSAGWLFQLLFPIFAAIAGAWAVFRKKITAAIQWLRSHLVGR